MVKTLPFPMQGMQFRSLVGELRSHMLCGTVGKKKSKAKHKMGSSCKAQMLGDSTQGQPKCPCRCYIRVSCVEVIWGPRTMVSVLGNEVPALSPLFG